MRRIQSCGVAVSKRPLTYSDLQRFNRTITCYSGIIAYRFLFLDVVSTHLRMEYEFQNKSRILLEKNADLNATGLSNNKLFNMKLSSLRNSINNSTLINGFLSTDFYANVKQMTNETLFVSNFE